MLNDGRSPGFGLTLVAETVNGFFLSAEMSSTPQGQGDPILPEDLGRSCATLLLEEVYRVRAAGGALQLDQNSWGIPGGCGQERPSDLSNNDSFFVWLLACPSNYHRQER